MDLKNTLTELGLSKNEAAVYLALLEKGMTQAGPLIKATKLHRMLVYNALDNLVHQGLATILHKKNIQLFQATDPATLADHTRRMNDLAKSIIPALRDLQMKKADLVTIRTLVGPEGFRTNLQDVVESAARSKKRQMCIIGSGRDTDFYDIIGDWYKNYTDLLNKHRVKKRLLAPESFSSVFKKKFAAEKRTELRTLPTGAAPSYTRITHEMVTIEIYRPQVIVIQIRNPAIAQDYLNSFELLWRSGKSKK